jgi:uncharacterized repeat protein (TIGR02543 family)
MAKFNQEGLRFIIGTLAASVTAILVASILSTSLGTLAEAIRETASSSSVSSSSSSSESSSEEPEVVEHTVTFNTLGGTAVANATLIVEHGEYILNFPATSKANHTFDGWYTGITPNDVLFTSSMPVVQDMTLFAKFTLIPTDPEVEPGNVTWVVAFDVQGGTPISSVQVEDGRTFQLPNASRTGYVFLGWYTGTLPIDVIFTSNTPVLRNTTLYARWQRQSFMITFLSNGGTLVEPLTAQAGSPIVAPVNPVRKNHTFTGWFTEVELTNVFTFTTMPDVSTTLYAGWEVGTFEGLKTACSSTECVITGYDGIHSELFIPAEIDGVPVTMVADRAFEDNANLVSITFEDGEGASSQIKTIGLSAFANMPALRTLTLPETSLKTIRNDAFRNSSSLKALDIPSQVTSLGTNVLTGTDALERVTVRSTNNSASSALLSIKYLFGGTVYNSVGVNVPLSLEKVIISNGATVMPNDFLRDLPMVREVVIPSSITSMGTNVLTGATNLTTLTWTFTSTVSGAANSFLTYAFGSAHAAVTNLPANLSTVTINPTSATRLATYALYNLPNVTTLNIPDNITEIDSFAFAHAAAGTSKLPYIDLPSGLLTLGTNVFQNSSELLELDIPDTVTNIGASLLTGTTKLHTLSYNHNSPLVANRLLRYFYGGTVFNSGGTLPTQLKTVEMRGEPTALLLGYFFGFTSIETILLPASLTTLNNQTFQGMTSLKQIQTRGQTVVPNQVILSDTITTLGTNMFQGSTAITYVKMPAALTTIPNDTFNGATNLETVVPPTAYTTIGSNAFLNTKLANFTFASSLTTIGISAFQGTMLTNVVLPNSVINIGNDAFRSMQALTSITFPSSVPVTPAPAFVLGTNVLSGAQLLTTVSLHIDVLPSANRTLRYLFGGTTVGTGTLPSGLRTVTLTGGTILTTSFFSVASANMGFITNVTLPSTLTEIQGSAFSGMTGLLQLTIPQTVVNIGASAFAGTTSITTLTFLNPALPTTLGLTLFTTMNSVALVYVPNGSLAVYQANAQFAAFAERLIETPANPV